MHAVGAQRGTCGGHAPARCENQASTKAEFRVPSVFIAGIRDLPAHQIQSARQWYGVCSAARSAAQQHGRRATAEAARRPPTQHRWSWSALTGAEGCAAVLPLPHQRRCAGTFVTLASGLRPWFSDTWRQHCCSQASTRASPPAIAAVLRTLRAHQCLQPGECCPAPRRTLTH